MNVPTRIGAKKKKGGRGSVLIPSTLWERNNLERLIARKERKKEERENFPFDGGRKRRNAPSF